MHGVGGLVEAHFKFGGLRTSLVVLRSSFGGIGHSTDKFGGHSGVCVQCGGVSPATDTRTTPRSASGGHMQVWWSFGSAEVRCHGWVV